METRILRPSRHDRGWPRIVLTQRATQSDQTYRLYVEAQGMVDGHDARGKSWEVIQWIQHAFVESTSWSGRSASRE